MGFIWNRERECMSRKDLEELQLARLKAQVKRAYEKVPFYREKLEKAGIYPEKIKTLKDVRYLPVTTKDDLRDNYPFGLFAEPKKNLVRLHASSGTTGRPTVVGYTRGDLEVWAEVVARIVTMAGVTDEDTAQIAFGYGLFTGAFGLHYGLEKVGALVVPISVGNSRRQIQLMRDFGTTALICTPSYSLHLAETARELGIEPRSLGLKWGLFGSEPWTEEMRAEIEKQWGIVATDNYGLSEIIGPGVSGECLEREGLHINEDHFLVEVVDPETLEPKEPGEEGELIITPLTKEALPLLRYRTRDISKINPEPCRCGRTTTRMQRVKGRTDDMLIIRGVNVFPSQIESVLMEIEGTAPHYQLIVSKRGYLDELEVQVEIEEKFFTGKFKDLEKLTRTIEERLASTLQISAKVKLLEPRSLERSEGKAKRVIDLRNSGERG
ncbi:phenylacetate--CoA ligase family protein [Carboxydothermus ferrireducens]|uniref:Phenylacetate-coenzyme A ligase n=2 Tax=Carboxydothermus TaxID=129957 RepID=A0ABX2RC51_9THEO|nr:phenylacetate--CoA ligase [Carboxydothermus ferrireducens]NYE57462.1 phenylacetate-CoA ligase [Carboxydothermus ferrireducens DSM 11255]